MPGRIDRIGHHAVTPQGSHESRLALVEKAGATTSATHMIEHVLSVVVLVRVAVDALLLTLADMVADNDALLEAGEVALHDVEIFVGNIRGLDETVRQPRVHLVGSDFDTESRVTSPFPLHTRVEGDGQRAISRAL